MRSTSTGSFGRLSYWIFSHKLAFAIIIIAVLGGGYEVYKSAYTADAAPQYQIERVSAGKITQTVSGTGQVSAENQVDITSQVSGAITGIDVRVGQHVSAGDLLATIDNTNAAASLASAKLSYAQLVEPAKAGDIANAQNSLSQSYTSAFNSVASTFTDLQTVIPGMNDLLYGQTGFLSDQKSTFLSVTGQNYRNTAGQAFDKSNNEYTSVLAEYKSLNRSSATSSVEKLLEDTASMTKDVATAVQNAQTAITWITTAQPDYDAKDAATAQTDVAGWANSVNGDVSNLISAGNTIASDRNSLNNLITGADALSIQAAQNAVDSAQRTYDEYFIRSPIDGIVGRIPVNVYDQASGSSVIATIVGDQKIADISLDEVDAAKVAVGDPVSITFNAINNFTATGTISEKDLVGTVSSGVVSYNVKVNIDTVDSRILPGMSVNVTITTAEKDGVLTIPSTAIKTQGNRSYVQIFTASQISSLFSSMNGTSAGGAASSSNAGRYRDASSTAALSSSTAAQYFANRTTNGQTSGFGSFSGAGVAFNRTVTVSTRDVPAEETIATGLSDDTNTEIVSGLQAGDWVVVKTVSGISNQSSSASAPSILNSLRGGGGARTGGAGGGGRVFIGG
ncbi:MAG: HlyD family efflux transporter periplasmic adaptor subunit [Patescibacteria group bacterium]|nr:HlyD family efflux transporter periplasmic adaptor subunit [Patescibacteria group bacterium]